MLFNVLNENFYPDQQQVTALLTRLGFLTPATTTKSFAQDPQTISTVSNAHQPSTPAPPDSPNNASLSLQTSHSSLKDSNLPPVVTKASIPNEDDIMEKENSKDDKAQDIEAKRETNKENIDANQAQTSDNGKSQETIPEEEKEVDSNDVTEREQRQKPLMLKKLKKLSRWKVLKKKTVGAVTKKIPDKPRNSPLEILSSLEPASVEDKESFLKCNIEEEENSTQDSEKCGECVAVERG